MGITLRNGIQINKVKTPPIYEGPIVFSDDQLIKVGGKYVTTDLQIDLNTDERITKDNIIQMKILDRLAYKTDVNYEEDENEFQYWANIHLGVNNG